MHRVVQQLVTSGIYHNGMQKITLPDALTTQATACRPCLLRPACAQLRRRASTVSFGLRPAFRVSTAQKQRLSPSAAQEQPDRQSTVDNGQIQSPTGSDIRPQVSESKLSAEVKEEPRLGLAGSIVMWGFLVVSSMSEHGCRLCSLISEGIQV